MDYRFKQEYVIWSEDLTKIFLEELGLPDNDYEWSTLSEDVKKQIRLVEDEIYGWRARMYGNETFWECDAETFYMDDYDENDSDPERKEAHDMAKRIYQAYDRLVKRGEIPEDFLMKIYW